MKDKTDLDKFLEFHEKMGDEIIVQSHADGSISIEMVSTGEECETDDRMRAYCTSAFDCHGNLVG